MALKLMVLPLALPNTTDPSGKPGAGKSYIVFGKANSSAINLSAIADASNPTVSFTKHNIRFTCR
jgi:hypothetical protein